MTDYFEKMNVNKRLEPAEMSRTVKDAGTKHSGVVGGVGNVGG